MAIKYYTEKFKKQQEWLKEKQRRQIPHNYSVAKAVLDILIDTAEGITLFDDPYTKLKKQWKKSMGIPPPARWRYNRAIKYLESLEHAEIVKEGDKIFIELTKKGKIHGLLLRLQKSSAKRKTWDGKWRLMIWDIPESSSKERDRIRYFVKRLGFYKLQYSVFITPYELSSDAVVYLQESGLIKYIRFLRVDKIDNDSFLRKHFQL